MKKYILIIGLLITSLAFSQGGYTKPVVTAINVTIADAGAIITATEVENALQENRALINLNTIPHLEFNNTDKTVWNNGLGNEPSNTSFGDGALRANTTGAFNTANGVDALKVNTDGSQNTATGNGTLGKTTTGDFNTAFGAFALGNNILGGSNTSLGDKAGYRLHNDIDANSSPSASVFIGKSTRALTNNDINQIVIGYNALGQGTNTVVLGNDDITDTYLKGNINGGAFIKNGGLSTEFLKADGSVSTGIAKSDLVVALRGKVALGDVSGTVDIDTSLGIHFTMNMTGNITSLTFSNLTNEELKTITLEITGDAGGYTITQPATVKPDNVWSSLDSTLKNQIQIYMFDISTPEFSTTLLKW